MSLGNQSSAMDLAVMWAREDTHYLTLNINKKVGEGFGASRNILEIGNSETGEKLKLDIGHLPSFEIFEYVIKWIMTERFSK